MALEGGGLADPSPRVHQCLAMPAVNPTAPG